MITALVEVTNGDKDTSFNWGKFMVAKFTTNEWHVQSAVEEQFGTQRSLLAGRGWTDEHVWVVDLQTGEGAIFRPGGSAKADLAKHAIWVCPMFEPFLEWLYVQDLRCIDSLPALVELPDAPSAMAGYRRLGPVDYANTMSVMQDDLAELLRVLRLGDHARPQSPHEVMQEALAEVARLRRAGDKQGWS